MPSVFEVIVSMSNTPSLTTTDTPNFVPDSPIATLDTRLDTAESEINALQAEDIVLDGRLDTMDTLNTTQNTRLTPDG